MNRTIGHLIAAATLFYVSELQATQQTFWPVYQYPPPTWSLAQTNDTAIQFTIGGSGTLYIRHSNWSNFTNYITPLPLPTGTVASYSTSNLLVSYQVSIDGANWFPANSVGSMTMTFTRTNDTGATQNFTNKLAAFAASGTSAFGSLFLRQSPTVPTGGWLTMTATNGGFLIGQFINAYLELSTDGVIYYPANTSAHLELSGPPGVPAILSISNPGTGSVHVSWTTQTNAHYQLQWNASLGNTNWNNLGVLTQGTVSNLFADDPVAGQTQRFYRVGLSP